LSCRTRKHGGSKRRVWRRIHIGIDERTLQIRAANLTTSDVGEAPMLPERLDQIPPDQEIGSVNADGASNTCKGHDALPGMAHGPSFRPARPQSREKQTPPVRSRATKPCTHCGGGGGRIVRRQWSGHRRRRAKTGMPCMKLPGRRLSARDFARQVAELEVRVAVLNGLTAPADPSPTWRHKSAQGRERHKPQTTRATEPTATVVFWRQ
jgi:hypothetical protein